jgi:hypothetical protein
MAEREETRTLDAVVQSVDLDTRQVLLVDTAGEPVSLTAGPEIRNLPQLEPGDRVMMEFYEAVAARMAEPGDLDEAIAVGAMGRNPDGSKPGGFIAVSEEMIVEFVSYDAPNATVVIIDSNGQRLSLPVQEELREFAAARKPGDRVHVTITESVSLTTIEG